MLPRSDIDIVLTWVDSTDPTWEHSYNQYCPQGSEISFVSDPARFFDWKTLKYNLRLINKNASWFRKIFIITNGQRPDFLKETDNLRIISHDQIFDDPRDLPTFNSTAIELNIHNIPELSEKFIIWNDDFFILKPISKDFFFQNELIADNLRLRFRIPDALKFLRRSPTSSLRMIDVDHELALRFSKDKISLINFIKFKIFFALFQIRVWHHPQAHIKTNFKNFVEAHEDLAQTIISSRFRPDYRFNQYAPRFHKLITGDFKSRDPNIEAHSKSIFVKSVIDLENILNEWKSLYFLCICEQKGTTHDELLAMSNLFRDFLDSLNLDKCEWEI